MPWSLWLFLSPPLIGFWLLPTVFGSMKGLLLSLVGAWCVGLGGWIWALSATAAMRDDDAGLMLLFAMAGLGLPIYGFTVGALTKVVALLRRGQRESRLWAASAVVLYTIPGILLVYFKGV